MMFIDLHYGILRGRKDLGVYLQNIIKMLMEYFFYLILMIENQLIMSVIGFLILKNMLKKKREKIYF